MARASYTLRASWLVTLALLSLLTGCAVPSFVCRQIYEVEKGDAICAGGSRKFGWVPPPAVMPGNKVPPPTWDNTP
jgi:hypothetical protein